MIYFYENEMTHKYTIAQNASVNYPQRIMDINTGPTRFNPDIENSQYSPTMPYKSLETSALTYPVSRAKQLAEDSLLTTKPNAMGRFISDAYGGKQQEVYSEKSFMEYQATDVSVILNVDKHNRDGYMPVVDDEDVDDEPYNDDIETLNEAWDEMNKRNQRRDSDVNKASASVKRHVFRQAPYTNRRYHHNPDQSDYVLSKTPQITSPSIKHLPTNTVPASKVFIDKERFTLKRPPVFVNNTFRKESFKNEYKTDIDDDAIYTYMEILKNLALSITAFLNSNSHFSPWKDNWILLKKNLERNKYSFDRLDESDADIAYVINKGDKIKFRIRDEKRFIPVHIYQYVLYHEMAHMSTHELQHTPKFHELLNLISLAGYILHQVDLDKTSSSFYTTNGQPILCKASFKEEIIDGCMHVIKRNQSNNTKKFYDGIAKHVANK